jgi:hypothetical protein
MIFRGVFIYTKYYLSKSFLKLLDLGDGFVCNGRRKYFIGCGSAPSGMAYTPVRSGSPTKLDEISLATVDDPATGKKLIFVFLGETWIQQVDGKQLLAGKLKLNGDTATLTQTHVYSEQQNPVTKKPLGWQAAGGQEIVLNYIESPPTSVSIKQ